MDSSLTLQCMQQNQGSSRTSWHLLAIRTLLNTQMRQTPDVTLKGNTGELSRSSHCFIHRQLFWFRYLQG